MKPVLVYLLIVLILAVAFSVACGSGDSATPASTTTPTESPPPSDAAAIRLVDFESVSEAQTMLRQLGGPSIDEASIQYLDLTGDRREDAIVPYDSGGTLGNVAFQVFASSGSADPRLILTRTLDRGHSSGLVMEVEGGKLIESIGEYGAEDPFCCPSVLRKTYFRWDGTALQVEREERITSDNPKR